MLRELEHRVHICPQSCPLRIAFALCAATTNARPSHGGAQTWMNGSLGSCYDLVTDAVITTASSGSGFGDSKLAMFNTPINSRFVYGSGASAPGNALARHIGISNLVFSRVPGINPSMSAAAFSLLAAF